MATGGPAGAAADEGGVVAPTDEDLVRSSLRLEVTLKTKHLIVGLEKLLARRSVRGVTDGAAVAGRFMLEDERTGLRLVTLQAGVRVSHHGGAATFDGASLVRVVAIVAAHVLADRVGMRQIERALHVEVTLEAGFRIGLRVVDGSRLSTGFVVNAAGAVTSLATNRGGVRPFGKQLRVGGGIESVNDLLVAFLAAANALEVCSGNLRRTEVAFVADATSGKYQDAGDAADERDSGFSRTAAGRSDGLFHSGEGISFVL